MPLGDLLARAARDRPEHTALVVGEQRVGYARLRRDARGLSAFLRNRGVAPGDRVLVLVPNSADTVVAMFATWTMGAIAVVVDPASAPARLRAVIDDARPAAVVAAAPLAATVATIFAEVGLAPTVVVAGEAPAPGDGMTGIATAIAAEPADEPDVDPDSVASIIYTSGSTGRPKGVMLTHHGVEVVLASVAGYLDHGPDDIVLCVLQLAFGYGLLQVLVTFSTGGTVVLERGFGFPYDIARRIEDQRITGLAGVPTLWALLLQLDRLGGCDVSSVRYLTNAAAAMPSSFVAPLRAAFPGARLFLMHGQTECLRTTFLPPDQLDVRPGSVGRGMPGVELWLEDEHGVRLPPGSVGEMIVRGEGVMVGYWNDAAASAAVVRPGRHPRERELRTRDLFRTDDDGWFSFVARTDDIIKSRGEKVSPAEIEDLLYALEGVHEARVIGVPDDVLGQAIRAEIVLRANATLDEAQVKRHLRRQLEPFKIPQQIAFVAALPKTLGGKIARTP